MKFHCKNATGKNFCHASIYDEFVTDHRYRDEIPFIHYPSEYHGQPVIKLCCSQHSHMVDGKETVSDYQRKKITASWVEFLQTAGPLPLKEVQVCTGMPQAVLDGLCNHPGIESLRIKWFTGTNLEAISKLVHLKKLFIESAPGLQSVVPLAKLAGLEVLILGKTLKVTDYSPLGSLKKVRVFSICSYQTYPSTMHMDDDSFLFDMDSLEYVDMCDVRVKNQQYLLPENVEKLKFAIYYC